MSYGMGENYGSSQGMYNQEGDFPEDQYFLEARPPSRQHSAMSQNGRNIMNDGGFRATNYDNMHGHNFQRNSPIQDQGYFGHNNEYNNHAPPQKPME